MYSYNIVLFTTTYSIPVLVEVAGFERTLEKESIWSILFCSKSSG